MAAVVVTESLDWRLHGFDLLSEAACQGDFALRQASWMVPQQYKPAELGRSEWGAVADGPPWAVDAWGLGCMMQEVFSGQPLRSVDQLRQTDVIPQALLGDYQKLLSSAPGKRLNPSQVRRRRAEAAASAGKDGAVGSSGHGTGWVLAAGPPPRPRPTPPPWPSTPPPPRCQVAESKFLNNRLVKVVAFMENIAGGLAGAGGGGTGSREGGAGWGG
jgi:hypothetical protein